MKYANYDIRYLHIENVPDLTPPPFSPVCIFFGKTVFGREHPASTAFPLYPLGSKWKCFLFGSKDSNEVEMVVFSPTTEGEKTSWQIAARVKGTVLGPARGAGGDTYAIQVRIGDLYHAYEFYCDRDGSDHCGWWFKEKGLAAQIE